MPVYARYLLRTLAAPTLLALVAFAGAVWLSQSLRFVDLIVNKGLSVPRFVYLTSLLVPSLVLVVLPFAAFIGTLLGYQRLRSESELSMFRATGLSDWQIARGAVLLGLAFTLVSYAVALWLMPTAYRHFRELQFDIRQNVSAISLQARVFTSVTDGLTVYIAERTPAGDLADILVHDTRERDRTITLLAERGRLLRGEHGPILRLWDGSYQERDADGELSIVSFAETAVDLVNPKEPEARSLKTRELYLVDLLNPGPSVRDPEERAQRIAEGHERLAWPLVSLALPLVAVTSVLRHRAVRESSWRATTAAAGVALAIALASFTLLNLAKTDLRLVPLLYAIPLATVLVCFGLLTEGRRRPPVPARGEV
ncbi:MAG: LptF/LptG family permease [Alphaproteobacteria bacterium]